MKNIEQIGWNYEHENMEKNARNIWFFRDTCHPDQTLQDILHRELIEKIDLGFFGKVFFEGHFGEYKNHFRSVNHVREFCKKIDGMAMSSLLLLGSYPSVDLLYGIDDKELLDSSKECVQQMGKLAGRKISKQELLKFIYLDKLFSELSSQRSFKAVENAVEYLDKNKISSVGCVFGDGHFREMLNGFKDKGVGVISFFPGKTKLSHKDFMEYAKKY